MAFADPRSCLRNFLQTGRNIGKRPPSFSLRNVQRDIRAAQTSIENIGDRVEGFIGAAARGDFLPGQLLSVTNEFRCPPTDFAQYFSQYDQPKFRFMFFASLELNPAFQTAFGGAQWPAGEVAWFIKQSGRPNVSYEYEETNRYNFRQKALRRAILEPVQIQLYDDLRDASHSFWTTFIRIQSPVTNLRIDPAFIENAGMNWANAEQYQQNLGQIRSELAEQPAQAQLANSASTGVLPGEQPNAQIIKSIKVYHLIDWGRKYIVYEYVNPRINEIQMDELSWENSDPNVIDVTFEYDTFYVHFPQGVTEDEINKHMPPVYPININTDEVPFVGGDGASSDPNNRSVNRFPETFD